MPASNIPNGTANRIWVGTASPATTPVAGLQGYEYGGEGQTSKEEFYDDFDSITTVGPNSYDGSYSGKWNPGDPGLAILKNAFRNRTEIFAAFSVDGTNGEEVKGRVPRFRLTGQGSRTAAGYQFSFAGNAEPTNVAAGL